MLVNDLDNSRKNIFDEYSFPSLGKYVFFVRLLSEVTSINKFIMYVFNIMKDIL